jgi:hypothetical protein
MALSAEFSSWVPGQIVRKSAGQYEATTSPAAILAAWKAGKTIKTYFVNNSTGSNAAAGDAANPLLSVATAMAKADADIIEIVVTPLPSRIMWGTRGTGGISPTKSVIIRAADGGDLLNCSKSPTTAAPIWTANGDGTFTCPAPTGAANSSPPEDWAPSARDVLGRGKNFNVVADAASVLNPGDYFHDTTAGTCKVKPFDGRNLVGDAYITPPTSTGSNAAFNVGAGATSSIFFYADKMYNIGGGASIGGTNLQASDTGIRGLVCLNGGGAFGSTKGPSNGLGFTGGYDIFLFDQVSGYNYNDTQNGHANSSGICRIMDVRSKYTVRTGFSNTGTDNQLTIHEGCLNLSVMPQAWGNDGRTYANIGTSKGVVFGGTLGPSIRSDLAGNSVQAGDTAVIDLYEVTLGASIGPYTLATDGGAQIICHGMDISAVTKTGNVTSLPMAA